jgi:hypothetical protein
MANLRAVCHREREFFPLSGWRESVEVEEGAAVQRRVRDPEDPAETQQRLLIDLVPTHQILVIAEVS